MRKELLIVCGLGACGGTPKVVEAPLAPSHSRPEWASNLTVHIDGLRTCLEGREQPAYVAFVQPLPSGATGINTVDAYGSVDYCTYFEGQIVAREPAGLSALDIADAGGVLFSLGPARPTLPADSILEEVTSAGISLGWFYWPRGTEAAAEALSSSAGGES